MAYSFNRVILFGNLGNDAETRKTANAQITNFSLATSRSYKKKDSEEWTSITEWHKVTAFNLPDSYLQKLLKGSKVLVEGEIRYEKYNDQNGVEKHVTKIYAEKVVLGGAGKKGEAEEAGEPVRDTKVSQDPDNDLPF